MKHPYVIASASEAISPLGWVESYGRRRQISQMQLAHHTDRPHHALRNLGTGNRSSSQPVPSMLAEHGLHQDRGKLEAQVEYSVCSRRIVVTVGPVAPEVQA